MTISTKKLEAALVTIAKFFEENVQNSENKTVNRLAYVQQRMLNGICWTAHQQAERTRSSTLPKAQDEVRAAMKAHRGDELSELTLSRKLDWLDRVNDQIAHADAFFATACDIYEQATGEKYTVRTPIVGTEVKMTTALDRAKAMLGEPAQVAGDYQSPASTEAGREAA